MLHILAQNPLCFSITNNEIEKLMIITFYTSLLAAIVAVITISVTVSNFRRATKGDNELTIMAIVARMLNLIVCVSIPIRHVAIVLLFGAHNAIFALNIYTNFILSAPFWCKSKVQNR